MKESVLNILSSVKIEETKSNDADQFFLTPVPKVSVEYEVPKVIIEDEVLLNMHMRAENLLHL
jgi:hypothetical protein